MSRLVRLWIGTLASFALLAVAIAILTAEIKFGLESVSSTAVVDRYTPKSIFDKFGLTIIGRGGGTAIHLVDGQPVSAIFRSYYFRRGPEKGEQISIVYLPSDPRFVKLSSLMQRYAPSIFPLVLSLGCGILVRHFHFS